MIIKKYFSGILLCSIIALLSILISDYIPFGAVTLAIVMGIVANTIFSFSKNKFFSAGISFVEKHILALAIVFMGIYLNFYILSSLGFSLLFLVVSGVFVTLISAFFIGKFFNISARLSLLLGVGNAICGSSAIAGVEKIIDAEKKEVGLSITVINLLGVIGMFFVPFVSIYIFQHTEINAGIITGNTLQAVGQAVAGGFSISSSAGEMATVVKMSRVLMLFPVILLFLFLFQKKNKTPADEKNKKFSFPKIPLFIIGFIVFSLFSSFEIFSEEIVLMIKKTSTYLLILAMAGIGLQISFSDIAKNGVKIFCIGFLIFLVQIIYSAGMIYIIF